MLEAALRELAEETGHNIYPGLSVEIHDFFRRRDDVAEYSIVATEDNCYRVLVKLRTHDEWEASGVFRSLVTSIEFDDATFYVRTMTDDVIRYSLLSATHDGMAFLCEVSFSR